MIRLKNNTGGYYSLELEDSQSIKPNRTFVFNFPGMEINIPSDYAASIASIYMLTLHIRKAYLQL